MIIPFWCRSRADCAALKQGLRAEAICTIRCDHSILVQLKSWLCCRVESSESRAAAVYNIHCNHSLVAQVKGWLCCKVEALKQGLKKSALGQAFQDMDDVQLAAYCIAMLAEYVQEPWLAELRDIYQVPTSGIRSCMKHDYSRLACRAETHSSNAHVRRMLLHEACRKAVTQASNLASKQSHILQLASTKTYMRIVQKGCTHASRQDLVQQHDYVLMLLP